MHDYANHWKGAVLSAVLITLMVYAAVSKLMVFSVFYHSLQGYPLLAPFAGLLAFLVPLCELLVASLLFFSATRKRGFIACMALLAVFTLYILYLLGAAVKLPCSCGGVIGQLSWPQHLAVNLFFIVLCALGLTLEKALDTTTKEVLPAAGS